MTERLDKFISAQTCYTRTDIRKLLWKRKISVDGKILRDGEIKIDPEKAEVIVDGRKIIYRDKVYITSLRVMCVPQRTSVKKQSWSFSVRI